MNLGNIRIVLVNPRYGGNIGSACRAMSNMGMSDLALVAPRQFNMREARRMACHAQAILDARKEFRTLPEAVADCSLVMVTTARKGLYRQHARSPREWAPLAVSATDTGRVALVFGREESGLTNEEIAIGTQIIQIPTFHENPSLNVAQAVMICCYEIFVASGQYEPPVEKSPEAPSGLRERMFGLWEKALAEIGFFKDDNEKHMMLGLRRILSRGPLTVDDVKILMGIARQTLWACGVSRREPVGSGRTRAGPNHAKGGAASGGGSSAARAAADRMRSS